MSPCLLSSKEVRAESVEYKNSKRKITVFDQSSLNFNDLPLIFNVHLYGAVKQVFSFFSSEVWFLIFRCDIPFDDNLLVELYFYFFGVIFRHDWFGMCTPSCNLLMYHFKPTSRATFIKNNLWNNYG